MDKKVTYYYTPQRTPEEQKAWEEHVAFLAKVLGNPIRIAILTFLAKHGQCYFGDISEILPIAKSTVSQHLRELKEARLIYGEIEGSHVCYCIDPDGWEEAWRFCTNFFAEYMPKKGRPRCC